MDLIRSKALGIVAVEHGRSSAITRRLIRDSAVNDGMLQALVLAPRSIHLSVDPSPPDAREGFRVEGLPTGEAVRELGGRPLPWIHQAATEDFKDLFLALRESARLSQAYLILMVLSTLLATIGLFANSAPVIIGAMILAPLMSPIISLAMGVLRGDSHRTTESARSLASGVALALFCAVVLTRVVTFWRALEEAARPPAM